MLHGYSSPEWKNLWRACFAFQAHRNIGAYFLLYEKWKVINEFSCYSLKVEYIFLSSSCIIIPNTITFIAYSGVSATSRPFYVKQPHIIVYMFMWSV